MPSLTLSQIAHTISKEHQLSLDDHELCIYNTKYLNSPIYFDADGSDLFDDDWMMCFISPSGQRALFVIKDYIDWPLTIDHWPLTLDPWPLTLDPWPMD